MKYRVVIALGVFVMRPGIVVKDAIKLSRKTSHKKAHQSDWLTYAIYGVGINNALCR